jgi:hypothetical protein
MSTPYGEFNQGYSMAELTPAVSTGQIRFSPNILRRMGEELNPNIDQGLLELVKNAYDADATECHIWLNETGPNRSIVIEDNGIGMSASDIISGWLVLGSSSKSSDHKTNLGRVPAGNKGLGRLAALRLGRRAIMTSRPVAGGQYSVELKWDEFDNATTVDEVKIPVRYAPPEANGTPVQTGTRIELSEMRGNIGRVDVRRLSRSLVLLADPFTDEPSSFRPYLHSEEHADLAKQVRERYFDQADYKLVASLTDGHASMKVLDWKGNTLWQSDSQDAGLTEKPSAYSAPNAEFELWTFLLSGKNFASRPVQLSSVREWLRTFGGVHVYADDLRVAPYGNPGNDWLDINLARAKDPEDRPSTNNSIGKVRITSSKAPLIQKTDRSGFVESPEFDELRRFLMDSLDWMASRRRQQSETRRQSSRVAAARQTGASSTSVLKQIDDVEDEGTKQTLRRVFESYERARDVETDVLRSEIQLYRTLSTAGITAATFAHESQGNPLKTISIINNTLKTSLARVAPEEFRSIYSKQLNRVSDAVDALSVLSSATLNLIQQDCRASLYSLSRW